jgi:hypothetical protein
MTQSLQDALLKAGLVSKEKLQKAENEKKKAAHEERRQQREDAAPRPRPGQTLRPSQPPRVSRGTPPPSRPAAPPPIVKKEVKKSVGFIEGKHHHHLRTNCEECERSTPDVEYYQHKNRSLDKYWLCVTCADKNNILDEFRQTMQSQHAQNKMFRRGYGPTKIFK